MQKKDNASTLCSTIAVDITTILYIPLFATRRNDNILQDDIVMEDKIDRILFNHIIIQSKYVAIIYELNIVHKWSLSMCI